MSLPLRIALVCLGLAYLISPVDIIPDLLVPWLGWIDDGVILWSIYYLIRHGELPWFLFKNKTQKPFSGNSRGSNRGPDFRSGQQARPGQGQRSGPQTRSGSNQSQTNQSQTTGTNGFSKADQAASGNDRRARSDHDILGIRPGATRQQIHDAYKHKIKLYHPDKLAHLGKEFTDLANDKFLEIQAAYDRLKK